MTTAPSRSTSTACAAWVSSSTRTCRSSGDAAPRRSRKSLRLPRNRMRSAPSEARGAGAGVGDAVREGSERDGQGRRLRLEVLLEEVGDRVVAAHAVLELQDIVPLVLEHEIVDI